MRLDEDPPEEVLMTLCSNNGSIPNDLPRARPSASPIWLMANIKLYPSVRSHSRVSYQRLGCNSLVAHLDSYTGAVRTARDHSSFPCHSL